MLEFVIVKIVNLSLNCNVPFVMLEKVESKNGWS